MLQMLLRPFLLALFLVFPVLLRAQLDLKASEEFLDIVAPIITEGEQEIYKNLPGFQARKYFQSIFWYKRNPTPTTTIPTASLTGANIWPISTRPVRTRMPTA